MGTYRVRAQFRVLSALIGTIAFIGGGFVTTYIVAGNGGLEPISLIILDVILFVAAVVFGWVALIRRAPATMEEFGFDDEDVIEYHKEMRTKDIYEP